LLLVFEAGNDAPRTTVACATAQATIS